MKPTPTYTRRPYATPKRSTALINFRVYTDRKEVLKSLTRAYLKRMKQELDKLEKPGIDLHLDDGVVFRYDGKEWVKILNHR